MVDYCGTAALFSRFRISTAGDRRCSRLICQALVHVQERTLSNATLAPCQFVHAASLRILQCTNPLQGVPSCLHNLFAHCQGDESLHACEDFVPSPITESDKR